MLTWSITLHGPSGSISTIDTGEAQFVVGTEPAPDVFTVACEGIMPRHAWVWISEAGLQVEDLGGGTLVNGYQITERVQVEYPASVQVGEVTLMIEVKLVQRVAVSPTPSSLDITIPQRAVAKGKASMEVTIPQRTATRAASRTDNHPNTQISDSQKHDAPITGGYSLVREIARGGMGQIYFGEDPQLKRNVAVKVSSVSEAGEDPRFSKEAEVLAQLAHPNIVPIYNIGVDAQSRPFYSMKLIKGRTLQAVLNLIGDGDATATKDYPRATLLTIFRKVCDAMMFAHSKGILHRDLKPENVMVGEYGEVLVMDWGLAKVLGEREEQASSSSRVNDTGDYGMTMEGEVMGTPQYMSPEQAMGMVAELDQRSDIYSLGGILYAILTLRPPIDGTTLDEVLTKVKNGSISAMVTKRGGKGPVTVGAPTAMGAEVPEALQAVTLKAMATHRDKRYASVEAFASDIERYQNGFATQAEDARAWKRIKLWMLRNKVLAASAAILLVSAVTFTLRLAASERVARTNEQKALKEKDASRRSAANAQIALAEAAESASDAPAIVRALSEVPEDLRGADWHYLQERIDASDFTVVAPDGGFWIGAENIPADPDRIVALSSSHDLYEVNVKTGAMQRLWNFSPERGHSFGPMSVSKDGKLVALGYWKAAVKERAFFCVNVCQLEDGTRVGQLGESEIDTASTLTRLIVSGELCVIDGKKKSERRVEAWDFWSGKRMWDAVGTHADFSEDQKSVFLINSQDTAEKRDARSGAVQVTGAPGAIRFHANFTENGMGSADWGKFFTPLAGYSKLRVMDPWTGTVSLEVAPTHGNYGSAIVPSANLFAVLGRTSGEGSVLEIRDVWSGLVRHVYPVPVRLGSGANQAAKILAKADAVAVRFQRVIKIWRFDVNTPSKLSLSGKETARLGDTGRVVRLKQEADKNILEVIDETQSDKKKQIIQELDISEAEKLISNVGSSGRIKCSADGERVIRQRDYFLSAYRNSPSGLVRLWGPLRPKSGQGMGDVVLHPNLDLFWSGGSVREFSSGRDLVQIDRSFKGGVFRGRGAVWVGSSRVAEIADPEGGDTESVDASLEAQQLLLWDANAGQIVLKMDAPKADCLCVSPDALWIAEGGSDKRVRIRSSRTLEVEQDFRVHQDGVTGIAWHPTLPLLVTASNDGTIRIWNLTDKRKVEEIKAIPKRAITLEISASGFELVEYMSNGTSVRILKPRSFQP